MIITIVLICFAVLVAGSLIGWYLEKRSKYYRVAWVNSVTGVKGFGLWSKNKTAIEDQVRYSNNNRTFKGFFRHYVEEKENSR